MVNRVNINRVSLLRHLINNRNINQELVGRQDGLHAIYAKPILRDNDNPVNGRLGVRTLEYCGEALHVKRRLDFRRTEQHEFVRTSKGRHVTGVVLGGNEFKRIGPRANLAQHVAGVRLRTTHVVQVVIHVDAPISAKLRIFDELMAQSLKQVHFSCIVAGCENL